MTSIDKIEKLLIDLESNRDEMKQMLGDLITFRKKIDELLPKKVDFRNKFVFEERMKTISTVLDVELKIRKQIDDSIKTEVNIRSKSDIERSEADRNLIEAIAAHLEKKMVLPEIGVEKQ